MKQLFLDFIAAFQEVVAEHAAAGHATKDEGGDPLTLSEIIQQYGADLPKTKRAVRMRNVLVTKNAGLVHTVAGRQPHKLLDREDLVQAGFLGMIRAIESFDPERAAFSTYAVFWIRHFMQTATQQTGLAQPRTLQRANNLAAKHYAQTGETPTAEELGVRPSQLEGEQKRRIFVSTEEVRNNLARGGRHAEDLTVGDTLAAANVPVDQQLEEQQKLDALAAAIEELPASQREVIMGVYWNGETTDQIAKRMNGGKETLRCRKVRALEKLGDALCDFED